MQSNPTYLHPDIDKLLQNFTKYVSKPLGFNKMYREVNKREIEYASNLPLQIILFFNVYYSFCWIIGTCFLWPVLSFKSNPNIQVWIILIYFAFILMVIFEIVRLYLGYIGNLCERVPELTGFWLLTFIIEIPLSLFLLVIVWIPLNTSQDLAQVTTTTASVNLISSTQTIVQIIPMQFALQLIHFLFIFFEAVLGFFSLRVLARYQISRFHYKQFETSKDQTEHDWLTNLEKTNQIKNHTNFQDLTNFKKE